MTKFIFTAKLGTTKITEEVEIPETEISYKIGEFTNRDDVILEYYHEWIFEVLHSYIEEVE